MIPYIKEEKERNRNYWIDIIAEWQNSGMSGLAWCKLREIKYSKFLYWKSCLAGPAQSSQTPFLEIPYTPTQATGIEIQAQYFSIRLEKDFDFGTLQQCLKLLREIQC